MNLKAYNIMKNTTYLAVVIGLSFFGCCKDKIPKVKATHELSEEMMAFFVNYKVGTKWIYQDTIDKNNFDTIELKSKVEFNIQDNETLKKGFELYYKPAKSKDFKIRVTPGSNKIYYVKVDPLVTAAGAIAYENNNGIWTTGVTYFDSINITGNKYYKVIYSKSNNMYQYHMNISNSEGIVFFRYRNIDKQPTSGADYKLIKTIKP